MSRPDSPGPVEAPAAPHTRRLALTFEAFHDTHYRGWLRYAHLQIGDAGQAAAVVDRACARLVGHWPHVLRQESVSAYAWAVLKEQLDLWLRTRRRTAAFVATASFTAAISRMLQRPQEQFAALESGMALYAAISRLPERQYDVVVLRYVLGYPEDRVARLLGVKESAVRSLVRFAKRRLAAELGIVWQPGAGE